MSQVNDAASRTPLWTGISTASTQDKPKKDTGFTRSTSPGLTATIEPCKHRTNRTIGDVMAQLREHAQHVSWMLRAKIATPRAGWEQRANCDGWTEPAPFDNGGRFHWRRAGMICHTCPVRLDCLADAWRYEQGIPERIFGVRGGLPATARRKAN